VNIRFRLRRLSGLVLEVGPLLRIANYPAVFEGLAANVGLANVFSTDSWLRSTCSWPSRVHARKITLVDPLQANRMPSSNTSHAQ
jgi:hypothetical protein